MTKPMDGRASTEPLLDIRGLKTAGDRVTGVALADGFVEADRFVAALGSYTPAILKPLGLRAPIYPVKGYSITVPIVDESRAPVSTIMDETFKIAITRLGDRIRVGGMAEISGFSDDLPKARRATLEHSVEDLFGGADKTHRLATRIYSEYACTRSSSRTC